MKLHEIARLDERYDDHDEYSDHGEQEDRPDNPVDVWVSQKGGLGSFGDEVHLTVSYKATKGHRPKGPMSQWDEPEDFGELEILKAVLADDAEEYDKDGEEVIKTWPKGTDIDKIPSWKYDDAVRDAVDDYLTGF